MTLWAIGGIGVGLLLMFLGLANGVAALRRKRTWTRTEGTITRVKETTDSRGEHKEIRVTYRYVDKHGERRSGTDIAGFRKPTKGTVIGVRYDPQHPEVSEPVGGAGLLMLISVGLPLVGTGFLAWGVLELTGG